MQKLPITRRTALNLTMAATTSAFVKVAGAQNAANVKIGCIVPLSGPWAFIGLNIKAGADFAIEEINASGGIKALNGA